MNLLRIFYDAHMASSLHFAKVNNSTLRIMSMSTMSAVTKQEWTPSVWLGLNVSAWGRMLQKHALRIQPKKLPLAAAITVSSLLQSALGAVESLLYGRKVAGTFIHTPPLFIIGLWRSGTTLLHELLCLDPRHIYPNTYECFSPGHFLLTERFFKSLLDRVMPATRPQDNMAISMDTPQEDEFALCGLGAPSPYADIAFPNRWKADSPAFSLEHLSAAEQERWEILFYRFLQKITFARRGRIIAKSPTHTYRIKVLMKLFPDAKFVHIVRNPYAVYASTVHLWQSMTSRFALQSTDYAGIHEYLLEMYMRGHKAVEQAKHFIPSGQFYELRYEDLVDDPLSSMRRLYAELDLDDFESRSLPGLKKYLAAHSFYKTNKHALSPETTQTINRRCKDIFSAYGYPLLSTAYSSQSFE